MAGAAVAIGWLIAQVGARAMRSLLFEVSPSDPATLLAVSGVLLSVAAISALVPLWRAMRVDPMVALRHE
jgi:putative ABC transport system permease protein